VPLLLQVWVTYRLLSVELIAQLHPDLNLFRPLTDHEVEREVDAGLAE
jgi:hypothetical protein